MIRMLSPRIIELPRQNQLTLLVNRLVRAVQLVLALPSFQRVGNEPSPMQEQIK